VQRDAPAHGLPGAHGGRRLTWRSGRGGTRVAVIAAGIPIALTANIARVILTGYIMYFFDSQYASGTYHTIEGLLMMAFGLSLLRGGCWFLDQLSSLSDPPSP